MFLKMHGLSVICGIVVVLPLAIIRPTGLPTVAQAERKTATTTCFQLETEAYVPDRRAAGAVLEKQVPVGAAKPESRESTLSKCPDYPLEGAPRMPLSPQFVVKHRTALNGKQVEVKGVVVASSTVTGTKTQAGSLPTANANPQPRIVLADNSRKDRDRKYDLTILLVEGGITYALGETVKITGIVEASKSGVYLKSNR